VPWKHGPSDCSQSNTLNAARARAPVRYLPIDDAAVQYGRARLVNAVETDGERAGRVSRNDDVDGRQLDSARLVRRGLPPRNLARVRARRRRAIAAHVGQKPPLLAASFVQLGFAQS
jgi:hypothetical protein